MLKICTGTGPGFPPKWKKKFLTMDGKVKDEYYKQTIGA